MVAEAGAGCPETDQLTVVITIQRAAEQTGAVNRPTRSIPKVAAFHVPSTPLNSRPHMLRTWRNNTHFSSVLTNYRLSRI
jgi:hypothetical protein